MKLTQFHDFTGNDLYEFPFVLVFRGTFVEVTELKAWVTHQTKHDYIAGDFVQVDPNHYLFNIHFADKQDAMFCRLSH